MTILARARCVDAETLAAFVDVVVGVADRVAVESHLARCTACRDVVSDIIAIGPSGPLPPRPSAWRRLSAARPRFGSSSDVRP